MTWSLVQDPAQGLEMPRPDQEPEYQTPALWTPEHVMHRMTEAWGVLNRMRFRVGPSTQTVRWPSYIYEHEDLLAQETPAPGETVSEAESRRRGERTHVVLPPTAPQISMMEEAFNWPLRYLSKRDGVWITHWSRARYLERDTAKALVIHAHHEAAVIAAALVRERKPVR